MIRLERGSFFGTRTVTHSVPGLRFSENEYQGNESIPRHVHADAFVCFLSAGTLTERSGSKMSECGAGSVIWHPVGDVHEDRFGAQGGRCLDLEFDDGWMKRAQEAHATPDGWTIARGGAASWLAHRISYEITLSDSLAPFALDALTSALMAELARANTLTRGRPAWLDRTTEQLRSQFPRPPSITALAEVAGVHRSHLVRVFHKHERCTIAEFVRRLRVDWACAQLRMNGAASISDIALSAGFADQAHFSRVFKRVTSVTPRAYRDAVGRL